MTEYQEAKLVDRYVGLQIPKGSTAEDRQRLRHNYLERVAPLRREADLRSVPALEKFARVWQ